MSLTKDTRARFVRAVRRAQKARDACVHWDYAAETSDDTPHVHDCCIELARALTERRAAYRAYKKATDH